MLPTLVTKAPELYTELSKGIRTNLTLDQIIRLAYLAEQIPPESINKGVIDTHMVSFAKTSEGLDILIPVPGKIHELRDRIFKTSIPEGRQMYADDWTTMLKEEGARVEISDASRVDGLGEKNSRIPAGKGDKCNRSLFFTRIFYSYIFKELYRHGLYHAIFSRSFRD